MTSIKSIIHPKCSRRIFQKHPATVATPLSRACYFVIAQMLLGPAQGGSLDLIHSECKLHLQVLSRECLDLKMETECDNDIMSHIFAVTHSIISGLLKYRGDTDSTRPYLQ